MEAMQPAPAPFFQPANRMPTAAIVLILIGDMLFIPWSVVFLPLVLVGPSALLAFQFVVLFASTMSVLGLVVAMIARPLQHRSWGVLVLMVAATAIVADGEILVHFFPWDWFLVGALGCVLLGAFLAIAWRPPVLSLPPVIAGVPPQALPPR